MRRTIAERFLASGRVHPSSHSFVRGMQLHDHVTRKLRPPTQSCVLLNDQPSSATRFVFTEEPSSIARRLIAAGTITSDAMGETCRMPCDHAWFEVDAPGVQYAMHVERMGANLALTTLNVEHDDIYVTAHAKIRDFPWSDQSGVATNVQWHAVGDKLDFVQRDMIQALCDLKAIVFMLSVPRVCEIRDVVGRATAVPRRGAMPVEPTVVFKRVKICVGQGPVRYQGPRRSGESEVAYHHRLHQVIGYFNKYHVGAGRKDTRLVWIPESWRGDPALGMIVKEHRVEGGSKTGRMSPSSGHIQEVEK